MSKLDVIKAKLAEILAIEDDVVEVEFASATTDEGVAIFWEGELAEGVAVFVEDEEGNRVALADGTYVIGNSTENISIEVVDGVIKTMTVEEVPVEEPEQTEEPEDKPQEEVVEEVIEEPEVEDPTNDGEETTDEAIVKLREEVNELYSIIEELRKEIEELKAKPAAMSATEQFEQMNKDEKNLKGAAKYTQYLKK